MYRPAHKNPNEVLRRQAKHQEHANQSNGLQKKKKK